MHNFHSKGVANAATLGAATLLWYALPDFVRSKSVRGLVKTAALGAGLAHVLTALPEDEWQDARADVRSAYQSDRQDFSKKLALVAAASLALTLGGESFLFRRGERRRRDGVLLPHTRQALWLGGLAAVAGLLPDAPEALSD